jgi:predicted HicB family RNase H-like nuclease
MEESMSIRMPGAVVQKIDVMRRARARKVSLNQMIVELIAKGLEG